MEVLAEGDKRLALLFRQLRRPERLARHGLQRILGPGLSSTGLRPGAHLQAAQSRSAC